VWQNLRSDVAYPGFFHRGHSQRVRLARNAVGEREEERINLLFAPALN
jgi:hypothetical protein